MIRDSFFEDNRGVSIAVTHVLTIGITTILITGLLVGGSGLLRDEKQRATQTELRTIGNRMAAEISSAYYSAEDAGGGTMTVRVSHPEYVAGDNYNVKLREGDTNCDAPGDLAPPSLDPQCLVLSTPGGDESEVVVPIDPAIELTTPLPTVNGGSFYIVVEESGGTMELTLQNDPPSPSLAPIPEVTR
ncbi:hypothetical protein [Halorubellus sp. PRR65]|uniref:DUF7266 family protein n=1 Tax=Halorubellus sp. PRR65 TaxID=3098148 RepID=UPI002B25F675|nr:hypothetical protein [Halorubellus sp. PRR65]